VKYFSVNDKIVLIDESVPMTGLYPGKVEQVSKLPSIFERSLILYLHGKCIEEG
jgi:hypothetical protein